MTTDTGAPLNAQRDIFISAPLENVWLQLTEIDRWHEWQPDVTSSKIFGKLKAGTVFKWKAKGLNITSIIKEIVPMQMIGWTGESLGMQAVHIWLLESRKDGTQVTTRESLSGWLAKLLKLFDPGFLEKSLTASLQVLKNQAEGKIPEKQGSL